MTSQVFSFQSMLQTMNVNHSSRVFGVCLDGEYRELIFSKVLSAAANLSVWLDEIIKAENRGLVLCAPNSLDWLIWDIASLIAGLPIIAINDDILDQIGQGNMSQLPCDQFHLISYKEIECKNIVQSKAAIVWDEVDGVGGALNMAANEDDVLSYVYSSGSTGRPKGLIISCLGVQSLITDFARDFKLNKDDSTVVFLPLSNFQQRAIIYGCLLQGANISICQFTQIFHYLKRFSPTFLVAPPAFYEQLQLMYNNAAGGIAEGMGGAIRFLISGMAPIEVSLLNAFFDQGITVYEAYGITEAGMVCWNKPGDSKTGTVGKPVVPGSVFLCEEDEVVIKISRPLCKGYFTETNTDNTFDGSQVFTGDIGAFDDEGFLTLRGRKKNVLVSKTGIKYCAEEFEKIVSEELGSKGCYLISYNHYNSFICYLITSDEIEFQENLRANAEKLIHRLLPGLNLAGIIVGERMPCLEDGTLTSNMKPDRNKILGVYCSAVLKKGAENV